MAKFQGFGIFILRVTGGLFMLTHGWPKLTTYSDRIATFPDPIGLGPQVSLILAIGSEVVCAVLLTLGVATRLVTIPLFITMIVAGLVVHAQDPFNKAELALLYAAIYAALFFLGTGSLGIGRRLFKNRWLH